MTQPPSPDVPVVPDDARSARSKPKPSPVVAGLLSAFAGCGVGHLYAGHPRRAIAWSAASFALLPAFGLVARSSRLLVAGGAALGVLWLVIWCGSIVDASMTASRATGPRASIARLVLFWLALGVAGAGSAMLTRRFVVEAFKIPSGSMRPTLLPGDHIFVEKGRRAGRGDILVFPSPERPELTFVKRVVGLPGDHLAFQGGYPIVNGKGVARCRVGDLTFTNDEGSPEEGDVYVETLGNGHLYLSFYDRNIAAFKEDTVFEVPPGELFVVGDNRNNSYDSRGFGGVPASSGFGVPVVLWLSQEAEQIAWERFGLSLDEPHLPPGHADLEPALRRCVEKIGAL